MRPSMMERWTLAQCVSLCVCLFAFMPGGGRTIERGDDSMDIITREDAEEIFYNVNLDKLNNLGIRCPQAEAPENGEIIGSGQKVGTVVYVQCKEGYTLQGPTVMSCFPVGGGARWDPEVERQCIRAESNFDETSPKEDSSEEKSDNELSDRGVIDSQEEEWADNSEEEVIKPPFLDARVHPSWLYGRKGDIKESEEEEKAESSIDQERIDHLPPACRQRPEVGPCRASFKRYFFNKATMECHSFIFSGCDANDNNFESFEQCNHVCLGLPLDDLL